MTVAQRWQLISGGLLAATALMALWTSWRTLRRAPRPPAGLAARCRGLILEHPQSAGLLILTALALPAPLALFGWAVADLWQHSTGLYGFLLLAPAAAAATAALAGSAALAVAQVAARRLSGERAKWDLLLGSLFTLPPRVALAAARRILAGESSALTWWSLAAMLVDGCGVSEAAAKGTALAAGQPGVTALGEPLQGRARRAGTLALVGPMPIFFGFSSLPALAFAGYRLQFLLELDFTRYAVLCAGLALVFCAFAFGAAFRAAVALVHASAIYLAATGVPAVRERVLARFQPAWVLPAAAAPAAAAAPPAAVAPAAALAPAPADAGPGPAIAAERIASAPAPEPALAPPPPPAATPAPRPWSASAPSELPSPAFPAEAPGSRPPAAAAAGSYVSDAQWLSAAAPTPGLAAPAERPRLWPIVLRGVLRMSLLLLLGGAVFAVVRLLDGASIARRERLLLTGKPIWGTVEDVQAEASLGQLLYRVSFIYPSSAGPMRGRALAGEGLSGRLSRGNRIALRVAAEQPGGVCLEDDFGYSAARGALLLAGLALLIVGGWSFIFRVL